MSQTATIVLCVCMGLYLVFCAFWTWRFKRSLFATVSVLDLIGLLTKIFGQPLGAYIDASILGLLGIFLIVFPLIKYFTHT